MAVIAAIEQQASKMLGAKLDRGSHGAQQA